MGVAQLYHDRGSYHGTLDAKKCRIIAAALFRHARRHTIHCSRPRCSIYSKFSSNYLPRVPFSRKAYIRHVHNIYFICLYRHLIIYLQTTLRGRSLRQYDIIGFPARWVSDAGMYRSGGGVVLWWEDVRSVQRLRNSYVWM